jgi:hypothetical protein
MLSEFDFKCKTSSGIDLCFFGGVCQEVVENNSISNQQQACVCPQGYGHDFVFYHSPNCALPDLALELFGGAFSLVWLLILIWYVSKIRHLRKPKVMQLATIGLVNLVSVEGMVIGIVAQTGFFEASLVMVYISFMCLILAVKMITLQLFEFANGIYPDRVQAMRSAFNYVLVTYTLALSVNTICCLVFARSSELWKYDLVLCVLISLSYAILSVLCVFAIKYINEFVGLLTATTSGGDQMNDQFGAEFASMATRLKGFRNLFAVSFILQIAFLTLLVLVRSLLGSFPFAWIVIMIGLAIELGIPIGITFLFPRFQTSSNDGSEKKKSKRQIVASKEVLSAAVSKESFA